MARNYSHITIKTLFGEARTCAYPGCDEPLIFRDREVTTVVAEIAHIRSEIPGGPRHDPDYTGEVNGPANLLLLCGKHHRPVDRHEIVYSIEELETWKAAQQQAAGPGTFITEEQARTLVGLTEQENNVLTLIARAVGRLARCARLAQRDMDKIRVQQEEARLSAARAYGPIYGHHDDGTTEVANDRLQLSEIERREWDRRVAVVREAKMPQIQQALDDLAAEVDVLRMISAALGRDAEAILLTAEEIPNALGGESAVLDRLVEATTSGPGALWRAANGE